MTSPADEARLGYAKALRTWNVLMAVQVVLFCCCIPVLIVLDFNPLWAKAIGVVAFITLMIVTTILVPEATAERERLLKRWLELEEREDRKERRAAKARGNPCESFRE